MGRSRILLADDHILLTDALTKLLEPQFEVVAAVADGRALLKKATELKPDLIVLKVSLPLLNGLDAGRQLKKADSRLKLIYLTMNKDHETIAEAFRIGATSYLLKTSSASELLKAIHLGLRGGIYLTPSLNRDAMSSILSDRTQRKTQSRLTLRQREVLRLLAEGRSMKEVAFALQITPRTVAYHKYRMMDNFDLHSTAALVRFAVSTQVA
jgi:DNA-binding NarL/FixJ family response regulator